MHKKCIEEVNIAAKMVERGPSWNASRAFRNKLLFKLLPLMSGLEPSQQKFIQSLREHQERPITHAQIARLLRIAEKFQIKVEE
jgi:hypothetical protein